MTRQLDPRRQRAHRRPHSRRQTRPDQSARPQPAPPLDPPASPGFPPLSDDEGWSALIDGMSAAFVLTDPNLRVIRWNPAAERMYGFASADVIGRSIYDLWVPRWKTRRITELNDRLLRGETWTGNLWMRRSDGTYVLARGTRAPIVDQDGHVVGVYALTFDAHAEPNVEPPPAEPPQPVLDDHRQISALPTSRQAFVGSREVTLTATEFELLELLAAEQNNVVPADELASVVWGHPTYGDRGFLQAHISRLRAKLRAAGAGDPIEAVRGVGYRLRD
jgi:PAS domain S-box-containing protein